MDPFTLDFTEKGRIGFGYLLYYGLSSERESHLKLLSFAPHPPSQILPPVAMYTGIDPMFHLHTHRWRQSYFLFLVGLLVAGPMVRTRSAFAQQDLPRQPIPVQTGDSEVIATAVSETAVSETAVSATAVSETAAFETAEASKKALPELAPGLVRFSFEGTPWREVVRWITDEADLALHVGDLPPGSFTYSDPNAFTVQAAIDRINLFLLAEGFTLVRSGDLLSVINLADPRSMQQLDVLAKFVTAEQLSAIDGDTPLGDHDVVKCLFPLGERDAEDAVREIKTLQLMMEPKVLSQTNQLILTDTVSKLRSVLAILKAFKQEEMTNGTIVKSFSLQHCTTEDILTVARPHLGLATGEMIGIDVSLSSDLAGKNLFVTGVEDKVNLIEGLVEAIDQPKQDPQETNAAMEFRTHFVEGGNLQTIYNVLQTLLAGQTVRLSIDESAGSIVALATPTVQKEIAQTVAQMQASEAAFEVIPLHTVDPYVAIGLIEGMLDLPDEFDDPKQIDPDAPKIDADPANMRLFVRAKKHQIDQIKAIVAGLEQNGSLQNNDTMRVFPLQGSEAERLVKTAAKFWRGTNPIVLLSPASMTDEHVFERVVGEDPSLTNPNDENADAMEGDAEHQLDRFYGIQSPSETRTLTSLPNRNGSPIQCQVSTRGLILESEDTEALDRFEQYLKTLSGPVHSVASPPIVFYLKHTKSDDALQMLGELLDGGESAKEASTSGLVNGYVSRSSSSSLLGSLVRSNDGTTTMTSGSITVVSDPRLNRLIAQGNSAEIELIENYLRIIDKDQSLTSIETYGSSHVIELVNTDVKEVADAVREAFAGRINDGKSGSAGSAQAAMRSQNNQNANNQRNGGKPARNVPASKAARDLEPKITLATHAQSNSLIVTAPDALFQEVKQLAETIDARGERAIEVITPINSEVFGELMQQVLLGEPVPRSNRNSSRDRNPSRNNSSRDNRR
ncbi:Bacterial type II/III secretion system short domain protein [Novipirellula aureliae]|uniref:Bacterial type II/III secretion system short domain protein n=1 Tax=Novipirellula aureliae TaxID=2527966 RepID=A0A5C6E7L0_9BACT|nr:secretin N-terminal domain-containing protein [Novipirellula aureliae]TWU43199.1 Bacterial type II/III secretion system short domain protein [Novipirellula aureliae]